MRLFWTIRYLDTRDRQFKNRNLRLNTDTLAPAMKAAIEIIADMKNRGRERQLLRFRHLFHEMTGPDQDDHALAARAPSSCRITLRMKMARS